MKEDKEKVDKGNERSVKRSTRDWKAKGSPHSHADYATTPAAVAAPVVEDGRKRGDGRREFGTSACSPTRLKNTLGPLGERRSSRLKPNLNWRRDEK